MILLALDSCLSVASVAVSTENKLLGLFYINNGLTHSTKIVPMINSFLSELDMSAKDIDAFACTNGPGSFTGIRIGMSTVKGLALPEEKPVVTVSSLKATAYKLSCQSLPVCAMTDARNSQVFYGLYKFENLSCTEILPPSAADINEVSHKITTPTIVCGDGAVKYHDFLSENKNIIFAPIHQNMPDAASLAVAAFDEIKENGFPPAELVDALYVRKSSAEQEKERMNKK